VRSRKAAWRALNRSSTMAGTRAAVTGVLCSRLLAPPVRRSATASAGYFPCEKQAGGAVRASLAYVYYLCMRPNSARHACVNVAHATCVPGAPVIRAPRRLLASALAHRSAGAPGAGVHFQQPHVQARVHNKVVAEQLPGARARDKASLAPDRKLARMSPRPLCASSPRLDT